MVLKPQGVVTALITPTDASGNLKVEATKKLLKYVIGGGVHGLCILSAAGEYYALDTKTKLRFAEIVVEESGGDVPVYIGIGCDNTYASIELAETAQKVGANALAVLTPMFVKCNDDELYDHYAAIAASTDLPVVLYSLPGGKGILLSASLVSRLSKIENIVGIKDTSGNLGITEQYIRVSKDEFSVMAGYDIMILATLIYGGAGAISATSNIAPKLAANIYNYYMAGNLDKAREAQLNLSPLRNAFTLGSNPAAVLKEASKFINNDAGSPIAPIKSLNDEDKEKLKEIMAQMKRYSLWDYSI